MVDEITEKKQLQALVEAELNNINQLLIEMDGYKKHNSKLYRRAKGSILHDFYNACERIFKEITHRINGGIKERHTWHKKLLHQMTIETKGLRPAVLSEKLAAEMDEYLAFRHLFRNIYGFELDNDRLDRLAEKFEATVKRFKNELRAFLRKL